MRITTKPVMYISKKVSIYKLFKVELLKESLTGNFENFSYGQTFIIS